MSDIVTLNGYKIKDEKAVRSYESIAQMKADTKLKEGYHVKTKGYYEANDGGHGEYIIVDDDTLVDDGGSIHVLSNGLRAKLIINNNLYAEQFGAYGDNTHDDTLAIQSLLNYCKINNLIANLCKNYLISSSINISGQYILINGEKSSITYSGNDSAIKINNCIDSTIYLGEIFAESGNGIEFYTRSDTESQAESGWSQYIDLTFKKIRALDKCIYFNRSNANNGWISEIRLHNGKLETGNYGIYADSRNLAAMNNISVNNIGFEGITTGVYMANKCVNWSFNNCRYAEAFTTLIQTVGVIQNCEFNGTVFFPINKCNMSADTSNFIINAPSGLSGGKVIAYVGAFYEGAYRPQIKNLTYLDLNTTDYADVTNYEMPDNVYTDFIIVGDNDTNLASIKLNKSFPTTRFGDSKFAITEFIIYLNFSSSRLFSIYNSAGGVVFANGHDYYGKYLKLKFTSSLGWICEEMNVVPTV